MKRYILLLFVLIGAGAFAQETMLTFNVSGRVGIINGSSFGRFVKSYNTLNANNKTKLTNFGTATGWSLAGDFWINKGIFMGYYQHKVSALASSTVNDYYTREFHLTQKSWGADVGGGGMSENGGVVAFIGIYFAIANISSDLKYRDGYRSLGADAPLNGIYHGFGFSGAVGAKGYVFAGPVGLTASVRWCPISGPIDMTDFGKGTNATATQNIPEDWGTYIASGGVSYNYDGAYVKPKFQSFFIDLGIAFKFKLDN